MGGQGGVALKGRVPCFFSFFPEEKREEGKITFPFFLEFEAARGGVRLEEFRGTETGRTMVGNRWGR